MRDTLGLLGLMLGLFIVVGLWMGVGKALVAGGPSEKSVAHANSPETELARMTYLALIAPDLYSGYVMYADTPLNQCIEAALLACGAGRICSVCVSGGNGHPEFCAFQCQDADGFCPARSPCDPDPDPNPDPASE